MKFNTVIFDLDGVIIDSYEVQKIALKKCYEKVVGKGDVPYNEFFSKSGNGLANIFAEMNIPKEAIEYYIAYSNQYADRIKVIPFMRDVLKKLTGAGIKCGICTGKERKRTIQILKDLDLIQYFNIIVCSDDVKEPKPNAESILLCMEQLNADKTKVIYIGDAVNDVLCAKNADVSMISVTWGVGIEEELRKMGCDYVVNSPEELLPIIME